MLQKVLSAKLKKMLVINDDSRNKLHLAERFGEKTAYSNKNIGVM